MEHAAHALENTRPPPTSSYASVAVLGLPSRARSRGPLPRRVRPPVTLVSATLFLAVEVPIAAVPPATILPTRGSSLSPRRRAEGRARPPRDRPPVVATARGDRPPRLRSFASAAQDGLRRLLLDFSRWFRRRNSYWFYGESRVFGWRWRW